MFFRVALKAVLLQKLMKQKADGSKCAREGVLWCEKIQSLHEPRESGMYWLYNRVQRPAQNLDYQQVCVYLEIMEHRIGEEYLIQISVFIHF